VQHAEAKAARDWMLPLPTPWDGVKRRAWVLRQADQIIAALRVRSGREAHLMHLLITPDARELATDIVRFGISQIADTLPIWLVLRDYQEELLWSAEDLGFQPIDEQSLWVRHNVSFMRRSAFARVLEPTRESGSPSPQSCPQANKRDYMPERNEITSNIDLLLDTLPSRIRELIAQAEHPKKICSRSYWIWNAYQKHATALPLPCWVMPKSPSPILMPLRRQLVLLVKTTALASLAHCTASRQFVIVQDE
jgi:hypothetical protein